MRAIAPALIILLAAVPAFAARRPAERTVVCEGGVLRWKDTGDEVALFGVNYYPPFAINYADLKQIGADPEKVIRDDVAHFVRLGLDLVRLHVWDREISDGEGNLLENDHLRLLDYLLDQCKRNGIYAVLTPIAWWGTSPEYKGFSTRYTMHQMTTSPEARAAQQRYLAQFVRHKNRYTGLAYADEPAIAALELINEPQYPEGTTDAQVTEYIDALAGAIREAGCRKPIFYNGWGGRLGAVGRSTAEGCTFGWYPTGLVSGHALKSNFLPRVQDYPEMRSPALAGKARGVYEFDCADVAEGYLYPAMARSFRAGGAQFAAQFQYDPLPLAPFNAGWQTHFLNLCYAPHKALGFLVAADAFHNLPRLQQYGAYPASNRFGEYHVSYEEGLGERVGEKVFLYCADTKSRPPAPERLERIAGCGSSPVVQYDGTGAYFLDRLAPGAWRLEVYPDNVWVADPFGPTMVGREVSRVYWREREMKLSLPDLGPAFTVAPKAGGRPATASASGFRVRPGVYLLRRRGITAALPADDPPFVAPAEKPGLPPAVWHEPPASWVSGKPFPLKLTVAAPGDLAVRLSYRTDKEPWRTAPLARQAAYQYAGEIPAAAVRAGDLQYRVSVGGLSFPGAFPPEKLAASADGETAVLFAAGADTQVPPLELGGAPGQSGKAELASLPGGGHAVRLTATGFGEAPSCGRINLDATPAAHPERFDTLVVRARALEKGTSAVELGFMQADGQTFGWDMPLSTAWRDVRISLSQLRPLWGTNPGRPDEGKLKQIAVTFGAWLYGGRRARPHGLEIERIWLEPPQCAYRVPVQEARGPILLLPGDSRVALNGQEGRSQSTVAGKDGPALRVAAPGFAQPGACVSFRVPVQELLQPWQGKLAGRGVIHLRARAGEADTNAVEMVLIEEDGAPWGCNVPLTQEWQDIRVPVADLRFFEHWDHPAGRGGPGDRFHPERLEALNFCFGAWLYPDHAAEPHAVEIEGVWLEE